MPETIIENDTDIVKQTLVTADCQELDIKTPYVIREVMVPQQMRIPLYVAGQLKSAEALTELGLTVREYTRLEVETTQYGAMYAANPDLAVRVRVYKAHLDGLGLPYTATSDEISAAINAAAISDTERLTLAAAIQSTMHDIEVNLTLMQEPGQTAWAIMPKLIKYLPPETPKTPVSEVA